MRNKFILEKVGEIIQSCQTSSFDVQFYSQCVTAKYAFFGHRGDVPLLKHSDVSSVLVLVLVVRM